MELLDWARAIAALMATLALIGLLALGARRLGMVQAMAPAGKRRMRVSERLMLDPRRQLVIVAIDDKEHVLLLSPFGDRPVTVTTAPAAPEPEAQP